MSAQHVIEAAGGKAICLEKRSQVTNEQVYHIKAKEKDPVFMIISQPLARNESDLREPEPVPQITNDYKCESCIGIGNTFDQIPGAPS